MKLHEVANTNTTVKTKKIAKGLTRQEALKAAPYKDGDINCRSFHYNPSTGVATWV